MLRAGTFTATSVVSAMLRTGTFTATSVVSAMLRAGAFTAISVVRRQCGEVGEDVEERCEQVARYDASPTLIPTVVVGHLSADGRVDRLHSDAAAFIISIRHAQTLIHRS